MSTVPIVSSRYRAARTPLRRRPPPASARPAGRTPRRPRPRPRGCPLKRTPPEATKTQVKALLARPMAPPTPPHLRSAEQHPAARDVTPLRSHTTHPLTAQSIARIPATSRRYSRTILSPAPPASALSALPSRSGLSAFSRRRPLSIHALGELKGEHTLVNWAEHRQQFTEFHARMSCDSRHRRTSISLVRKMGAQTERHSLPGRTERESDPDVPHGHHVTPSRTEE
jgi:hypothetical protein